MYFVDFSCDFHAYQNYRSRPCYSALVKPGTLQAKTLNDNHKQKTVQL